MPDSPMRGWAVRGVEDDLAEASRGFPLQGWDDVGVYVQCDGNRRVTEHLRNDFGEHALDQKQDYERLKLITTMREKNMSKEAITEALT